MQTTQRRSVNQLHLMSFIQETLSPEVCAASLAEICFPFSTAVPCAECFQLDTMTDKNTPLHSATMTISGHFLHSILRDNWNKWERVRQLMAALKSWCHSFWIWKIHLLSLLHKTFHRKSHFDFTNLVI